MKITLANGVAIELSDGETIPASMLPLIAGQSTTATVARALRAPAKVTTASPFSPVEKFIEEIEATPAVAHRKRRPTKCYLTESEYQVMEIMLENPAGITTEKIASILGITQSSASSTLHRIRTTRPYKDTSEPLVTRISDNLHKVTALGARLNYQVGQKRSSPKLNRRLGWGR